MRNARPGIASGVRNTEDLTKMFYQKQNEATKMTVTTQVTCQARLIIHQEATRVKLIKTTMPKVSNRETKPWPHILVMLSCQNNSSERCYNKHHHICMIHGIATRAVYNGNEYE
jgi:hypothetical protein